MTKIKPLIVVGAGRSGTTFLRNTIVQHNKVVSFRYEMNAMWKYCNEMIEHDCLTPEQHSNKKIKKFINNEFKKLSDKNNKEFVLDKTVANIMRIRYVQDVLPNSKILHIIRDGRAVVASAMKRWQSSEPTSYYFSKFRTVPKRSIPYFLASKIKDKLKGTAKKTQTREPWGSKWIGFSDDISKLDLVSLCARQWARQIESAEMQKKFLKAGTYSEMRYEDLINNPNENFKKIHEFFMLDYDDAHIQALSDKVNKDNNKKWQDELSHDDLDKILNQAKDHLIRYKYL